MFDDTLTLVSWRARPRSFVALMGLYGEQLCALRLAGSEICVSSAGRQRSSVAADCDLVLNVTERCPYTTTLNLTYLLSHPTEPLEYPDMRIRIYHDAHLVEAQAWAASHPHPLLKSVAQPRGA